MGQEAVWHAAPDHRGQHLDIEAGRALRDRIPPIAAKHGCRDGHDILDRKGVRFFIYFNMG